MRVLAPAMSLSLHTPPAVVLLPAAIRTTAGYCLRQYAAFGRGYVAIAPYAALGSAIVPLAQYAFAAGYVAIAPYAALGSAIVPLAQYAFVAGYVAIAPYARFFYRASHRHGEDHQIESTQSPDSTLHATVHCV